MRIDLNNEISAFFLTRSTFNKPSIFSKKNPLSTEITHGGQWSAVNQVNFGLIGKFSISASFNLSLMFAFDSFSRFCSHGGAVCLSACWDTSTPWPGRPPLQGDPPGKADPPLARRPPPAQCILGDTVNKRAVFILLECNSCVKKRTLSFRFNSIRC